MPKPLLDYDLIADVYDERFRAGRPKHVSEILNKYSSEKSMRRILEVGCGTGVWLDEIDSTHASLQLHGLDISRQMLLSAYGKNRRLILVNGSASLLPYVTGSFDLVISHNAIHHFLHPQDFILEASRTLDERGRIIIIGMDPHVNDTQWYLYDYFNSTRQIDLDRFPSHTRVSEWLELAGFIQIERREIYRIVENFNGREVFDNPYLQKHMISQLAMISDESYQGGLERMRLKIEEAEQMGTSAKFQVNISVHLITGVITETVKKMEE